MKTCPFCGGRGRIKVKILRRVQDAESPRVAVRSWCVQCANCEARSGFAMSQKDAVENWDQRKGGASRVLRLFSGLNPKLLVRA